MVVVMMAVVFFADKVHLVHISTLGASLNRAILRYLYADKLAESGGGGEGRRELNEAVGQHTVSHRVPCESAGKPVQPTYRSSAVALIMMGSSIVPAKSISRHVSRSRQKGSM